MRFENELIAVELDDSTGGFTSIIDKKTGQEFIGAPDRASLMRLIIPEGLLKEYPHYDGQNADISVDGPTATVRYSEKHLEAVATLTLDGAAMIATLEVENKGDMNIEEVMFPRLLGLAPVDDAAITWPCFWKRRYDDLFGEGAGGDHHTWNEWTQKIDARYPSHLTSAWCDYGNNQGGIAIEGRHNDFSIMDFSMHKIVEKTREPVRRTLDMFTVHPRRIKPGERYCASPVRIRIHQGDWHIVADEHREWLETWVRKPDRAPKFAEAIGWHFYFMKHQDGLELNTYDDLPKMAQAALDAGCPYLLLFGWQEGGHDNNYMYRYFPNEEWGGLESLKRNIEKCRAMGVELMPFYNGTLANVEMPEHKEYGHKWEAKTRADHPYYAGDWARHNYDAQTRNRAMLHHEIAPCDEHVEHFVNDMKRIIADYGFGNTQLDQISEKMLVDYNEAHIKTSPDRVYVDGLAEILSRTRKILKEANPDGVMISEVLNDFTGQWCDSSWDWNILMPFPEPVLYTLPWLMASHEVDALEYNFVNKAFVYKMHLDMKIDGGDAPITKYPKFAAHVKANAALRRATADYYAYADFRDEENFTINGPENLMAKAYHNKTAGKVGIVVAEVKGEAGTARLSIDWPGKTPASVHSNTAARTDDVSLESLELALQPYEIKVICIDL